MSGAVARVPVLASLLNLPRHARAFEEALRFLWSQRHLMVAMARRDIGNRYAGQMMGTFWALGHPLFQMAVLLFVFGVVFKQKIGGTYEMPLDYTVYILTGLAAWQSLAPILASAANSVVSNANLIKQFVFDARILPVKEVIAGALVWVVSVGLVIVYTLIAYQRVPWTYALIPVVTAMHFLTAIGLAWGIAALSVFFKDMKDLIVIANTAMLYLLPVVYLPTWVPDIFRPAIFANPFSYLVWVYQDVFYFGRIEHPAAWIVASLFALIVFTSGYRLFRRLQPMFGTAL